MYDSYHQFTPLSVRKESAQYEMLLEKAAMVVAGGQALELLAAPKTKASLFDLVQTMNCYYSNIMEGVNTLPLEIAGELEKLKEQSQMGTKLGGQSAEETSTNPRADAKEIAKTLNKIQGAAAASHWARNSPIEQGKLVNWICQTHLLLMSDDEKSQNSGHLRNQNVKVGIHTPPKWEAVPEFTKYLENHFFSNQNRSSITALIDGICLHQKFEWVHPFEDGNGRVGRLLLDRWMADFNIPGAGLWSMSRGFARADKGRTYKEMLSNADMPRQGDLDGRGNLSERQLANFVSFSLDRSLDQTQFMGQLFDFKGMEQRIRTAFEILGDKDAKALSELFLHCFRKGEMERGEASRITGFSERKSRDLLRLLLDCGFLKSETPKGAVSCGFPTAALGIMIPNLYPQASLPEFSVDALIAQNLKFSTESQSQPSATINGI